MSEKAKRDAALIRNNIEIVQLDFKAQTFSETVKSMISDVEIIRAQEHDMLTEQMISDHRQLDPCLDPFL